MKLHRIDPDPADSLTFTFDNASITARHGDTIAAALLAAGVSVFRTTPVRGSHRAPWCMMGACYDCLVEIDGAVVQACMTPARQGQIVKPAQTLPVSL